MQVVRFADLVSSVAQPAHAPASGAKLTIATKQIPFVAPPLRIDSDGGAASFGAEVLFIEAPAAVGKSTLARQLSAERRIPMLDLATVPVATGTLTALISDLEGDTAPLAAFHQGKLPVIIDALDEGRLLSHEAGFESFLETCAELVLKDRSVTDRPKLIIFGRSESSADAMTLVELVGAGVTSRKVHVEYFGEAEARELLDAYAKTIAKPGEAYLANPKPVEELVTAYFRAIEDALSIKAGALWTDPQGRAFAGSAPVLAALGSLLARMENFIQVSNRLTKSEGVKEAWDVIETVLVEILQRERGKLCEKLENHVTGDVPPQAYDAHEQLRLLSQLAHGQPVVGTGRVQMSPPDLAIYREMVESLLPDHPFISQRRKLTNPVLASFVLAHAVHETELPAGDLRHLAEASRQPFLWRSLRRRIGDGLPTLDGRYLGHVLNSFWSDPLTRSAHVDLRRDIDDLVGVYVPEVTSARPIFTVAPPVVFQGLVRDCDARVPETDIRLDGHVGPAASSTVQVHGETNLTCATLDVAADEVALEGRVRITAEKVNAGPRLSVRVSKGKKAEVGWGGVLRETFPWNKIPSTLPPEEPPPPSNPLEALLDECRQRFPIGAVLTLNPDCSPTDDDRMNWVVRDYGEEFPKLIKLLFEYGLARSEQFSASGDAKIRVHFDATWGDLRTAVGASVAQPRFEAFRRAATAEFAG